MQTNKKLATGAEYLGAEELEEESSFSFKNLFKLFVLNWQWFLLSLFICVAGAFIYLRYKRPVYQVTAKMLIKDEQNNRRVGNQMLANMQDLGIMTNSTGIDNEVEVLQSSILSEKAVRDLKIYVEYYSEGKVTDQLIYKIQPFNVDFTEEDLDRINKQNLSFRLKVKKDGAKYNVECDKVTGPVVYNKGGFKGSFTTLPATIETPYGPLTFTKNVPEEDFIKLYEMTSDRDMIINILPPKLVGMRYAAALTVEPTSKMTSIAQLTINDLDAERAYDYLKQLSIVYNEQANEDKNEIAVKTEQFINNRLEIIHRELGTTESELEDFKRENNLTDPQIDAQTAVTQHTEIQKRLTDVEIQLSLLNYLSGHVNNPANRYQIIPSNIGTKDPVTSTLINEYNKVVQERNRLMVSASETAPQVAVLTAQLDDLEVSIKTAVAQARRSVEIERNSIERQFAQLNDRVTSTPEQERILTQIGREQEVKSALYLMLLQKREENQISLEATADKGKLIDEPVFMGQVSPKKSIILMAALVLGFVLPLLIFYLLNLMRYKIEGREDVVKLTRLPVVADVPVASDSVKSAAGIVVHENQNNQIEEVFRSLRANIQFMLQGNQKVILFTSTTSGEGKTFNAANLAVSFALLGKKVILLGLDIRKPALGRLFSISDREVGITPLLVKDTVTKDDLNRQIRPSGENKNLDLLLAGPIPPNPAELLARDNMKTIIDILREEYDYVILDTAPVGLVSDTLQLGHFADVSVFVCRADYTPKSSFDLINTIHEEGKMPNICIVLNGVDMSKKKYGYYYGYGRYGKYGRYGRYGRYGNYGNYGNYADSHYANKDDNSIKR